MTASASKTVARASVTRFIGNLPCNHCERRKESTDRREYSWRGKLCQGTDEAAAADGIFQPFPLSTTAEPDVSRSARVILKLSLGPKSEGALEAFGVGRPDPRIDDPRRAF